MALKHFEVYLQLRKFAIRADHSVFKRLQTIKNPEQQLFRWLAIIQGLDFDIFHRKGILQGALDAISRRPCPEDCKHCQTRDPGENRRRLRTPLTRLKRRLANALSRF